MTIQRLDNMIGLCRAAGGVTTGFDSVLTEVRRGRAVFVLIADDASERTVKQLRDKCAFYNVPCFRADMSAERLSDLLGKRSLCVQAAFTRRGPCRPLLELLRERSAQEVQTVQTGETTTEKAEAKADEATVTSDDRNDINDIEDNIIRSSNENTANAPRRAASSRDRNKQKG